MLLVTHRSNTGPSRTPSLYAISDTNPPQFLRLTVNEEPHLLTQKETSQVYFNSLLLIRSPDFARKNGTRFTKDRIKKLLDSLPVKIDTPIGLRSGVDHDTTRMNQKMKQIALGILTRGFLVSLILDKECQFPFPVFINCPKRTFDSIIQLWRVNLHKFDAYSLGPRRSVDFQRDLKNHPNLEAIKRKINAAVALVNENTKFAPLYINFEGFVRHLEQHMQYDSPSSQESAIDPHVTDDTLEKIKRRVEMVIAFTKPDGSAFPFILTQKDWNFIPPCDRQKNQPIPPTIEEDIHAIDKKNNLVSLIFNSSADSSPVSAFATALPADTFWTAQLPPEMTDNFV